MDWIVKIGWIQETLIWMDQNPNWSGWAQAIGGIIGILIAIAVPAYQRHTQTLDMRRQAANLNLVLASSGAFLINDIVIFLNRLVSLAGLPRSSCRDDSYIDDLFERIRSLEDRETSHARIVSLYTARGVLLLTNRELRNPDFQERPLSANELQHVQQRIQSVKERQAIADYDADYSLGRARSTNAPFPGRPIARMVLACWAFFKHPKVSLADRLFGTR